MAKHAADYLARVAELLERVERSQPDALGEAADACVSAIASDRLIHVFGSGHSSLVCQDVFGRAGGLLAINWIMAEDLLPLRGLRAGAIERVSGLAAAILDYEPITAGDVLIVVSNSGRNPVPVEMAEEGKARGLLTVAITSLDHSHSVDSRAPSGRRFFEVADVIIDNLGTSGDAVMQVEAGGDTIAIGPTSTIVGAAVLQGILVEAVARLAAMGIRPPVFRSANLEGGDSHNDAAFRQLGGRIPSLLAADIARVASG